MKKAVMYGAGNIGRGFVGALFSQSGYAVTFIDVADETVNRLNLQKSYPIRIVTDQGFHDQKIFNVDAIHGRDSNAVAEAVAQADILATAVGANVLPAIVSNLAAGLRVRFQSTEQTLNIIVCENLMGADKLLKELIAAELTSEERAVFNQRVGLVKASIGRMVPVQTPQMQAGEPLRVCVEPYDYLPVDRLAFKGEIPQIRNMIAVEPFDFYSERKLYIHNMGHAICAYLGDYQNLLRIDQSINDPDILIIVQNAMLESATALARKYDKSLSEILNHIQDLLSRFANTALQDTCQRVGGDPARKISAHDRLMGAAARCLELDILPVHICVGITAAVLRYQKECHLDLSKESFFTVLHQKSALLVDSPLIPVLGDLFERFADRKPLSEIRRAAGHWAADHRTASY